MSTLNTHSHEPSGSLLGWLGLRNSKADSRPDKSAAAKSANQGKAGDLTRLARRQLVEAISSFLLDNDLEVSPANLLTAHGAFSGIDPRLARQIASRAHAGEQITQEWLDEVTGNNRDGENADIERLMVKLEANLDAFSKSASTARNVTTNYNAALEQHVEGLEKVEDETGQILSSLAGLAKAMLERTRKVEEEMRRSEEEAKSLRKSLARARKDANIDHLTGLPNRRAFEGLLEKHYREAQAAIEPLSVAFCDIDHFKRINDTHGHDAGDRVIKAIAETLATISNDNCHVARHGGEEFVMLFRGLTPREAQERLDRTREQLANRQLINRKTDEPFGQVTFSGGVADVFGYANPREALGAADEALYKAKESGRNRILLAGR